MRLNSLRVRNYKSFADSGTIALGSKFTVILGRNNSGKSAFIEGFRNRQIAAKPNRNPSMRRNAVSDPASRFDFDVSFSPEDLFDQLMANGGALRLPAPNREELPTIARKIFQELGARMLLEFQAGSGAPTSLYPSHQLFGDNGQRVAYLISANEGRRSFRLDTSSTSQEDHLPILADSILIRNVFVFSAERLRVSRSPFDTNVELQPDAANLPRALFEMQAKQRVWEDFNSNVNRILPNVKRVVITGQANQIEVKVWPVDPNSDRDDLVMSLQDSGTGVAQVLAILCAAMTRSNALIAIDEPSNFLHSGAVKELIRLLRQYDHQYVVTTHSLDVLSAADPELVYLTEWSDCVSTLVPVNVGDLATNRRILSELGVSMSDVVGVERILWVEGETEELCLPTIVQAILGFFPSTLAILRVRSTSEVLSRKHSDLVRDIYVRLSSAGGLIPSTARFLFDRERLKPADIDDLRRAGKGAIEFLGRATFENYLLQYDILRDELNSVRKESAIDDIGEAELSRWMNENGEKCGASWSGSISDEKWLETVDAPKLLAGLFRDLASVEYAKTKHSPSLARRLVAEGGQNLSDLKRVVETAIGK